MLIYFSKLNRRKTLWVCWCVVFEPPGEMGGRTVVDGRDGFVFLFGVFFWFFCLLAIDISCCLLAG